jgi:zinc carboxypeptidase
MARRAPGLLALLVFAAAQPVAAQSRVVQVPVAGRPGLDSLAALGFEVADVRLVDGGLAAVLVVSPETQALLERRGYVVTALPPIVPAAAADTFRNYHSFDDPVAGIRATLAAWAGSDPDIHVDSVGASLEGRPILAVKVGPAGDDPGRPNVLFLATHHAREWISTAMAMRLIRWLADSASPALVGTRDVWVIPVENPDGYQFTFTNDRFWRKNRRPNSDSSVGVDPNRNYPAFWGVDDVGSSPRPFTEIYRGTAPASEPETQAVIAFHAAHPPVVAVSYHSFSGLVLYPYGYRAGALSADVPLYRALAGTDLAPAVLDGLAASTLTHYHPGPGWNLYTTNGEYTDWAYRAHGTIAFTTELTSGCCAPGTGLYYGFAFPDDSALVERVFRDNLPFALAAITAAADLRGAQGASGTRPTPPGFESLWPEAWLSLDATTPRPLSLTMRTATGATVTRSTQTDSLSRGTIRTMWRTDLGSDTVRALRADGTGIAAELITLAGAEPLDAGWSGWARDSTRLAGSSSWSTARNDTLVSPVVDLNGRSAVWLQLWTRHRGSTFSADQRGVIQFSGDSGASWTDVGVVVGDGPAWYPIRVELPQAAGRRGARVRFISERDFPWWLDAVGFATDAPAAFLLLASPGDAEVSENPVRGDQVVISWPAGLGTGDARVTVYAFTGERLHQATVLTPTNEYVWNLSLGGGTRRVVNGGYIVVVDVDGRRYRRRLFVARPRP